MILQRTVSFFERISFQIPTQNNCYQERTLQIQTWQDMVVLWWRLNQSHSVYTAFFQSTSLRMLFICLNSLTVQFRIIVSKKELFRFKPDKTWLYCGEEDSISHTQYTLPFFKALHRECYSFVQRVQPFFCTPGVLNRKLNYSRTPVTRNGITRTSR